MEITPLEPWIKRKIGATAAGAEFRRELENFQLRKLRDTVDNIRNASPFYRRRLKDFRGCDISSLDDISRLPFTDAGDIITDDLRFLCVSRDEISRIVTLRTSGTTAEAKRIHFTEEDLELTTDLFHHGMKALVSPGQKVLILMPGEQHGSVGDLMVKALRRMDAEGIPHGIVVDEEKAIGEIVDKKVDCLIGIPVQVLGLARHRKAKAIAEGMIKSVLLSADYVPMAIARELGRIWGCKVFNHYGMTEMGLGAAVDCRALAGYHIREADLFFEIVDPLSGRPLPDGEEGEIVFTTLTRSGMPLVRYRTGDLSRFIPEPCPCGTVLKRLEWVKGRTGGWARLGNGYRLSMADLDEALFPLSGIRNFRVVLNRENGADILQLILFSGEGEGNSKLADEARCALEGVPAVRAAIDDRSLLLAPVLTGAENWISSGSIKRKITDRREEM
jgi:phenylacetate-CoA ligase